MNAVIIGVLVMLVLSVSRIHVVLSLVIGAFAAGLAAGLPLSDVSDAAGNVVTKGVMSHFQDGLANGATIALSYAMLGAFAMAITHSGLPQQMAGAMIRRISTNQTQDTIPLGINGVKWGLLLVLLAMGVMSQNVVPIHIAFIPMIVPPLLLVFNRLYIDRRLLACVMTFGLVTTYMFLPYGFGAIFLNKILLGNIEKAGMSVQHINVMEAMAIPALGMEPAGGCGRGKRGGGTACGVVLSQCGGGGGDFGVFCDSVGLQGCADAGRAAGLCGVYDAGGGAPLGSGFGV